MIIEDRHLKIVKDILGRYKEFTFYAFGSRVTGSAKRFSDLDLCFFEDIPEKIIRDLETAFEESDLPYTVDLIDGKTCQDEFKKLMLEKALCVQAGPKVRRIEKGMRGHFHYLPSLVGVEVLEKNGIFLLSCGLGSSMFNIVFGALQEDGVWGSQIQGVKESFKGQPFAWWVPPSKRSSAFKHLLIKEGFICQSHEYAMECSLVDFKKHLVISDLSFQQVMNKAQLEDFVSLLDPYDATARLFYEKLSISMLLENESLFVGYQGDEPVVIGGVFRTEETACLFSVLTKEECRGRGLGHAMMEHLMSFSKDQGANAVVLSASSDSGFRLYEKLGFKVLGQFDCLEWEGS